MRPSLLFSLLERGLAFSLYPGTRACLDNTLL
jgi:hypothetical protein